ncbi:MAG: M20/M25/M40 family metallo-hydrolase [Ignavibacteriales bacterium]|nr:M20/M25/M40 family metallo-hydrolase [Ignavibacteriales bacterium]
MKNFLISIVTISVSLTAIAQNNGIRGFLPSNIADQRKHEAAAQQTISEKEAEQTLFMLTKEPHHAGSAGGRRVAEYVRQRLKEFGFDSRLAEYHVLLPTPRSVSVTILEPVEKELSIAEQTEFHPEALIPFNAYSPSGDVTAEVVYANYALAEDFQSLEERGIDVTGKIVIARYGGVYRGLKVLEATKAGAIGVILYSDPSDDGYMAGDVYPKGPMRPWDGVQRGTIRFAERYPGDPLTPGTPATKDAKRISLEVDPDMPEIPCVPLSYGAAQHILQTLEGPSVPRAWQGGLPFTYHFGAGPTKVRIRLDMDFQIRPIWNNVAVLRGTEEPDQWIILGGHRDGWIFGAQDPNGGTAVLLEAARAISRQVKAGWKPRRTIVIAQWDAEEYGLIGSTEWGEQLRDELKKKAVVYMNFDATISGPTFGASATPSLDLFLKSITADVLDPGKDVPVLSAWWQNQNKDEATRLEDIIPETAAINVGRMGGGSDHVVFQNHLGIPSMGFGFGGPGGIYHSYYDNFDWMKRFGDPGFRYHAAAARLAALAGMRMANADVLPFSLAPYADEILKQLEGIEKRHKDSWPATLSLDTVKQKASQWKTMAMKVDEKIAQPERPRNLKEINSLLSLLEREFAVEPGLEGREWFKHRIVVATGYESVGLPGIHQAAESGNWESAARETRILASILDSIIAMTSRLDALL